MSFRPFRFYTMFLLFAAGLLFVRGVCAAGSSSEYTDATLFKEVVLNVTNTYRKQHNATALRWNESLADFAGEWSRKCVFKHSGGPNGENLSSGYPNASASIVAWGHERVDYDFKKGDFSTQTGHFTQLVWKSSSTVGCARTECNGTSGSANAAPGWFVVCEYYPPGNVIGAFKQNVQAEVPPKEQPPGPSDPKVPQGEGEGCPLGAVCSAAGRVGGEWRMVSGGVLMALWMWMWWIYVT